MTSGLLEECLPHHRMDRQVRPENYQVRTPTVTIGVRGTDHEPFHISRGSPLASRVPTKGE